MTTEQEARSVEKVMRAIGSTRRNLIESNCRQMRAGVINGLATLTHAANKKWWVNPKTKRKLKRNRGEMLMLIVSEISEAMEGERKNLMDDKLTHRKMAEVELADAVIRIFDYAAGWGYDLGGAIVEKMEYNRTRKDHSFKARLGKHGKKF